MPLDKPDLREKQLSDHRHEHAFRLLRAEKSALGAVLVYATASGLTTLAVPLAAQSLVSSVASMGLLQPIVILTAGLFLALCVVGVLQALELALVENVLVRFFAHAANRFADGSRVAATEAPKFYDAVVVQKSLAVLLVEAPTLSLQLAVSLFVLTSYHPFFLIFSVALLLAIVAYLRIHLRTGQQLGLRVSAAKHDTARVVIEGARAGVAVSAQENVTMYQQARAGFFALLLRQTLSSHALVALAMASFLALGSVLVITGQLTLGQLVAGDILIALIGQNLTKLPKLLEQYYELTAALAKIDAAAPDAEPVAIASAPRPLLIAARLVAACVVGVVLALIFVPWQQTAFSQGRVIAYAPSDRQQSIEAPIEGRILRWHVQEGQTVSKGDPIVDISDNDPEILTRLGHERDAVERRLDATRRRTLAIEERIVALVRSRDNGIDAAGARIAMAKQRVISAQRALDAAKATVRTTELNIDRQTKLHAEGLSAKRTVELADLDHQRALTEEDRALAALDSAQNELVAIEADRARIGTDAGAQISEARAALSAAEAEMAIAGAEMARMDVRLARQSTQAVIAPRDGTIMRVIAHAPGGHIVKAGDVLATLVPQTQDRAVELFVSGLDAPLIQVNQKVRLQFEGWPAVQFAGWPSIAVGTFGGRVQVVDSASGDGGKLRILVVASDEPWPDARFLRQGVRAQGWNLLGRVRLGFEVWRRLNGFAPSLPDEPKMSESKDNKG